MSPRLDVPALDGAWRPGLGARPDPGCVSFRVWAPSWRRVELIVDPSLTSSRRYSLEPCGDGMVSGTVTDVTASDLYSYLLDGEGPFPDPASRFDEIGLRLPFDVIDVDDAWLALVRGGSGGALLLAVSLGNPRRVELLS